MPPSSRKPLLPLILRCLAFFGAAGIAICIYILLVRSEPDQTQQPEIDFTQFPNIDLKRTHPADGENSTEIVFPSEQ